MNTDRKSNLRNRSLLAGGVLLSGLALIAGTGKRTEPSAAKTGVNRHSNATLQSTAARIHQWQWAANGKASYSIKHSVLLEAGDSEFVPGSCGLTEIAGRLHACVVEADAQTITLAMQLSDAAVTVDPAGDEGPRREPVIEDMLNHTPGLLHLGKDGKILSCELPAALAGEDRTMLQGIFATEFILGQGDRWEATESQQGFPSIGHYQAESDTRFRKSRQAFAAPEGQPSYRITSSAFTATAGSFWIETLKGKENVEVAWQNSTVCTASSSVDLKRLTYTAIPESLLALAADPAKRAGFLDSAEFASHDAATTESARERQHLARLVEQYEAVPATRMVGDLAAAVANAKEHADTLVAIHALRDWLLANPGRSGEIVAALKDPNLADGVTARAAHALELAGHGKKEAQDALAAILAAPPGTFPPTVLMQAAVAAGGVGRLQSPELHAALVATVAGENPGPEFLLNDAALFALGSLVRDNPELEQGLVDTLSPRLALDGSFAPEDIATAVRTLANARADDAGVMERVRTLATSHEEADVRMATIDFFAASGQPEAIAAIQQALTNDVSDDVRRAAVESLTSPELITPESLNSVLGLLGKGSLTAPVEESAVASLANHQAAFPEIRRTFEQLLPGAQGDLATLLRDALSRPL